jgi:hypothetical protein
LEECACAGVQPRYVKWESAGESPVEYVIAKNLHRRHLTIGQR